MNAENADKVFRPCQSSSSPGSGVRFGAVACWERALKRNYEPFAPPQFLQFPQLLSAGILPSSPNQGTALSRRSQRPTVTARPALMSPPATSPAPGRYSRGPAWHGRNCPPRIVARAQPPIGLDARHIRRRAAGRDQVAAGIVQEQAAEIDPLRGEFSLRIQVLMGIDHPHPIQGAADLLLEHSIAGHGTPSSGGSLRAQQSATRTNGLIAGGGIALLRSQ